MKTTNPKHYPNVRRGGKYVTHHRARAEAALGKPLPPKAVVHHADGTRRRDSILVICPDELYHKMLHRRMRALAACGNANWRKCRWCLTYDDPANLRIAGRRATHSACESRARKQRKDAALARA